MPTVPGQPFRFGVNMRTGTSGAAWGEAARRAEALGYSTLTVPDHFTEMFSPMPAVMAAAAATTRLRVGTLVLNNDFRHPVLLAREAALIDLLTDGRLQLGPGAGYMKSEYEHAGAPFARGGVRGARLGHRRAAALDPRDRGRALRASRAERAHPARDRHGRSGEGSRGSGAAVAADAAGRAPMPVRLAGDGGRDRRDPARAPRALGDL